MSYKNALAGLDHGGGKAVIIGDPEKIKTEELLLAYGRFVASLGGRYVTACDVGTYVADMDVVARECRWTTGRSPENGGAGDSSVLTAFGVFQGMRACAQHLWGDPTLRGRTVGIAGVGKVGHHLVEHLLEDGAEVVVTDVRDGRRTADPRPAPARSRPSPDTDALIRIEGLDVYAPCALGGALDDDTVPALTAKVVCGAANNQLAHPGVEKDLADRGDPLRAGLRGERRRRHPGRRRAARLRLRAVQGEGREDLRHHAGDLRTCEDGRHSAGRGGRPDRRAADGEARRR